MFNGGDTGDHGGEKYRILAIIKILSFSPLHQNWPWHF